jgi:phosphatidylethanolamine-binding protein (PEBP) family uncharacterized protein
MKKKGSKIYKRTKTKRSRTKRSRTKRSRTKRTKQAGGSILNAFRLGGAILEHLELLKISYGNTLLQPNEDLTGKAMLYKQKPHINFNPHKDKTYLITLTDPDAPVGTWTHYVVLIHNNVVEEIYPYQPPTPPANSGIHRYIFTAYAYKDHESETNNKLKNKNLLAGNVYYKQILEPIIKNKDAMTTFQFTVQTK